MITVYKNCKYGDGLSEIAVLDGVIVNAQEYPNEQIEYIDLGGLQLYPGLVDIHLHGCVGADTMDGTSEALSEMSDYLCKMGTLSYLPTTMTESVDAIRKAVTVSRPSEGAEIMGFHLEGPYINRSKKGAQNENYIKDPDITDFKGLYGDKGVQMITLAPELDGSIPFIEACPAKVSIGHTDANYDISIQTAKAGACCLTHTFNAMPPMLHRAPGPIGAAIDANMYVQVICDGLHVHGSMIKMLYRTFGRNRMVLISDSMRATGLSDGEYMFGGQSITVKDSVARVTADGALAGSTKTLFECVKQAVAYGIPQDDAFHMATKTPCELMGFTHKGELSVGHDADIIGVNDDLELKFIIKGGKRIL